MHFIMKVAFAFPGLSNYNKTTKMKRRDFLKRGAAAGVAVSTLSFSQLSAALSQNQTVVEEAPDMVAVMGGEPDVMLRKALEAMGGIGKYVKKGQTVAIKPNIGWDKTPEMAANTNPELVGELVKQCLAAGAKKVTVFDHTCHDWKKCYTNSGIEKAAKDAGATMVPGNDEIYYSEVKLPKGVKMKEAKIHKALQEADVWFNVPVLKNHGGAKMTISMKNYMGIVWDRGYFHANDLQQCIADACTWDKKPALNIVDAYRVMKQNGPVGTSAADVAELKTLIVSPDIVAADTASVKFFNQVREMDLDAASHIKAGEKLNLGTTDLDKLNIKRIKI